jgi:hypothetical protein
MDFEGEWGPKMRGHRRWLWLAVCLLVFVLDGCSPVVKIEQDLADHPVEAAPGQVIGQSFFPKNEGLSGVEILMDPGAGGQELEFSLYDGPEQAQLLASQTLPVPAGSQAGYQVFQFPVQARSAFQPFFMEIKVLGDSPVLFPGAVGESYQDGALYLDDSPQDLQMAFQLAYQPVQYWLGLAGEMLRWALYAAVGLFAFVLPGWALLSLFLGNAWQKRRWTEKLSLAAGAGLAVYPVVFLWTAFIHVPAGQMLSWLVPLASLAWLAWTGRFSWRQSLKFKIDFRSQDLAADFLFVVILGLIFLPRFWAIRSAAAPLWGDSYQHTMIAQLIADNRGLFSSWLPYEAYETLTVQYGFSANAAVWMWLTGMSSAQAVLVYGQVLNGLAILSIYALAVKISGGSRWAGNAGLLVGGLLSLMPGFYVNWGRYAQLAGQAILPAAVCLVWYWLEEARIQWRQAVLHGLVLAGMLLSYYRMAFYYAAFLPVLLVFLAAGQSIMQSWRFWAVRLAGLASIGASTLVLLAPWLANVMGSSLSDSMRGATSLEQAAVLQGILVDYSVWADYLDYVPAGILVLAAASLVVSLAYRRLEVAGVFAWLALVSAVRAAVLINLPGANMMQSFAVIISLYLFSSLAAAWIAGWAMEWFIKRRYWILYSLGIAILLGLALTGANVQRKILNPRSFAIVTWPDLRAMAWVRASLPPDAVFLVEGFRIYEGRSAVGSDAGWWIPLLTVRHNTMPPQYALLNERPSEPGYSRQVVELVEKLETHSPADPLLKNDICHRGISHVYVGQLQGKASSEKVQLFPADLDGAGSPLKLVFAHDRIRIYAYPTGYCTR